MNRYLPYGLAVAAALAAGWAGERVYHAWSHAAPPARMSAAPSAPPLPADPDEEAPTIRIPDSLPEFTLVDAAGKRTSISAWRGKSLVLNFWATWCAPCRREIPLLETLAAQWSPRNVAVVGVAVDHRAEVVAFAQRFHIAYPLLIGEQDALDAAAALGVDSPVFPFTVFSDRRGDIVAVFVGELHRPQADLILSVVAQLDGGQTQLTAARRAIADGLEQIKAGTPGSESGG